jgi:soluble P-type ATPase
MFAIFGGKGLSMINITIPGAKPLVLHHLVLDMNGTLTTDGILIEGVCEQIKILKNKLNVIY